jgi:hypothetical protein
MKDSVDHMARVVPQLSKPESSGEGSLELSYESSLGSGEDSVWKELLPVSLPVTLLFTQFCMHMIHSVLL